MIQILLATHNGEKYLRPLLDSLLAQTVQDFQILVSDDASSDGTLHLLRAYTSRFPEKFLLLTNQIHGSAKVNFMFLASSATADYVMFCDQDDIWLPKKIELALDAMKTLEDEYTISCPILIHTDLIVVDEALTQICDSFVRYQNLRGNRTDFPSLLMQNVVTGCTAMLNRALLEKGKLNSETTFIVMHDWWFALVASAFGRIRFLDIPCVLYRQHAKNTLGAKKWGVRFVLLKLQALMSGNTIRASLSESSKQAQLFQMLYKSCPSKYHSQAVKVLSNIKNTSKFWRRYQIVKYKLFKIGIVRNIGLLFFCS